jgi:hypothetical protein
MANEIERTITDGELCEIGLKHNISDLPSLKIAVEIAMQDYDKDNRLKQVTASDRRDLKKLANSMRKSIRIWEDLSETAQDVVFNSAEYLAETNDSTILTQSNEPEPDISLLHGSSRTPFNVFTENTLHEFMSAIEAAHSGIPAVRKPINIRVRMLIGDLWIWWAETLEQPVTMDDRPAYSPFERFLQDVMNVVDKNVSIKELHTIFAVMHRRDSINRRRAKEQ